VIYAESLMSVDDISALIDLIGTHRVDVPASQAIFNDAMRLHRYSLIRPTIYGS
jgi:hypothetical protein